MDYFYARVSTKNQKADRQLDAAKQAGFEEKRIYVDYESGKNFNRVNWVVLKSKLKRNDTLFIKSIDRLGRNYKEIIHLWSELTHELGVDIVVLDMPLLDTRREKNLLGTFISDLVLQVLSFVAENERTYILQRQAEGIAAAKARGVKFGRPRRKLPERFNALVILWQSGAITLTEAARQAEIPISTFRLRALELVGKIKANRRKVVITPI